MSTTKEILNAVASLDPENRQKVLDFARALRSSSGSAASLLQFAGSIAMEDLKQMSEAIAEGCETVNPDEW